MPEWKNRPTMGLENVRWTVNYGLRGLYIGVELGHGQVERAELI